MKFRTITTAILLTLPMSTAFAGGLVCKTINGTVSPLALDPTCKIVSYKKEIYPDLTFVGKPATPASPSTSSACFFSQLTATLGNIQVTGTAYSGLTVNDLGSGLTAASAITFKDANGYKLGEIFTQDVIVDGTIPTATKEELVMVDGTRMFNKGKGHLIISGNALIGATTFTGVLCADD